MQKEISDAESSRGDSSEEMDLAEGMPSHLFGLEATPTTAPTATPIRVHETDSPPTVSVCVHNTYIIYIIIIIIPLV